MVKKNKHKRNKSNKPVSLGPGEDCACPVCIFAKSQAPGDAYDLKDCPKCSHWEGDKKKNK